MPRLPAADANHPEAAVFLGEDRDVRGEGSEALIRATRERFGRVRVMKPGASRAASREVYLVARNYRL